MVTFKWSARTYLDNQVQPVFKPRGCNTFNFSLDFREAEA